MQTGPPSNLRDLFAIDSDRPPVPLEEVESIESIMCRFNTGAMSLGALSRECHETLAIAMNRINGKSNSGEGGEDTSRLWALGDVDEHGKSAKFPHLKGLVQGDEISSAIKQIASGRFGVTPYYLATASQLEIKVSQGAKPGEGGQLPGPKVSGYIATVRGAKEGVPLISPPPHHDIYSIEDLAQLIFDLKAINPAAMVSVKLVAEPGIGTVAAGVAKAGADVVQVSGHDGGTGAASLSSIKHAGSPWELGLSETHRVLTECQLRDLVTVRVDGGMRTGRDVVIGALLGAEEFGFGTLAMVAAGCVMARVCHLNSCPVGVTTQRPELREKFPGQPEHVVNYLAMVAEETRALLADLGLKSVDEAVGQARHMVKDRVDSGVTKTDGLVTTFMTDLPDTFEPPSYPNVKTARLNFEGADMWDDEVMKMPEVQAVMDAGKGEVTLELDVISTDRTVGTRISGELVRRRVNKAAEKGQSPAEVKLNLHLSGSVGQSFGAFLSDGISMHLKGEANDYVGKGMGGGTISIRAPDTATFNEGISDHIILGNTCLYGATQGKLFAAGGAGERFGVRNSGVDTVVEGAGDHLCEYMTGGSVVVLGKTGRNIGAGMTGGLAYVLDVQAAADGLPLEKDLIMLNTGSVRAGRIVSQAGAEKLHSLVEEHARLTGSGKAQYVLDNWEAVLPRFWQLVPNTEEENVHVKMEEPKEEKAEKKAPVMA